jgi:hypothetical protein
VNSKGVEINPLKGCLTGVVAIANFLLIGAVAFLGVMLTITVFLLVMLSWNIKVTIYRFTGDKRRPMQFHTKARKRMVKGVPHLYVKGYSQPVRDFKAEFYYPSVKSKWGALTLWEFEDGWLTPLIPKKMKLPKEVRDKAEASLEVLKQLQIVDFDYNEEMHTKLKLKIVDDVDADFYVDNLERIDAQYSGGFFEFLERNSGKVIVLFVSMLLFIGFIVWLDKAPEQMAICANVARQTILDAIAQEGLDAVVPAG